VALGDAITLESLRADYDAVFLGLGLAGVNTLGFFGAAATQQQGVTLSNVTSVAQALINLGLATQNT
jgi:NADPH-dependent glutamate synthase beta subunit-like oxidoreductase